MLTLLSIGALTLFILLYLSDMYLYYMKKPKYRYKNDNVEYYSPRFREWRTITLWDDNDSEREVTIYDTVRKIKFTVKYNGPGRVYIKKPDVTIKELHSHLGYKNLDKLEKEQLSLIEKENKYLKEKKIWELR